MLCDGRIVCGCADPYGKRVLGRRQDRAASSEIWNDTRISTLRAELNAGGSTFCGDCPLKLPLQGQAPTGPVARRRPAAQPPVHRVHRRLQHLVHRSLLRAGNRHHQDP